MAHRGENTEKTAVLSHFSVPRETEHMLCRYIELLQNWNERINLVAKSSLPHVWSRHVLDSAQLIKYVPQSAKNILDMGSGAGFPGLVLAIMGEPKVHLVESTGKKARFLQTVINDLSLNAVVHHARIESLPGKRFDVITARALKALPELLAYAKPLMHKNSVCLFLKGRHAEAELTEALKYWTFHYETAASLSDLSGSVLKISDLKARSPHGHNHARRIRA